MEAYLPIMLKSCKKKNYFPLLLLSARFVGSARVKCRGRIRAAMLTVPAGLFFADAGCRKNPRNTNGFRGFTKQCCNWISYGVVFLWGNDLETQVLNKLTSRFILSNNSIQIYEISDKKANRIFITLFADLWRTSASPRIIFSFERTGTVWSGHGNRFLKTWIILHILNAEIT